jgi:hypothetical protein
MRGKIMEFSLVVIRRRSTWSELANILAEINCPYDTIEYDFPFDVTTKGPYSHILIDCTDSQLQASALVGMLEEMLERNPFKTLLLFMANDAMKRTFKDMRLHTADDQASLLDCLQSSDAPDTPIPVPTGFRHEPEQHLCSVLRGPRFAMGKVRVWVNDYFGRTTIEITEICSSSGIRRAEIRFCPFCGEQLREPTYATKPTFRPQTV